MTSGYGNRTAWAVTAVMAVMAGSLLAAAGFRSSSTDCWGPHVDAPLWAFVVFYGLDWSREWCRCE